jgi:hypothetical protein
LKKHSTHTRLALEENSLKIEKKEKSLNPHFCKNAIISRKIAQIPLDAEDVLFFKKYI